MNQCQLHAISNATAKIKRSSDEVGFSFYEFICSFFGAFYRFGSKYRSVRTGIIYNNEMDDFSTPGKKNSFGIEPSRSNYIAPRKRPMSSMSPSIFVDSEGIPRLAVGASGGSRIISAISLVRNFVIS